MKHHILNSIVCVAVLFLLPGCYGKAPNTLGVTDGKLAPCPETDNCVSSQAVKTKHAIDSIQATGNPDTVIIRLSNAIESMFGSKIVEINETYIRAEYTSRVFRFVDDLECYYDRDEGIIDIRSASRIGYSDLNANRDRVEELRTRFMNK